MGNFLLTIITIAATAASVITLFLFYEDGLDKLLIKLRGGVPEGFIIFITGTNGVGKSTIAEKLAKKLGITSVVEVDDVREALRSREDLFFEAKKHDEYKQLSVSSYLSDTVQFEDDADENGSYS